MSTSLVPTTPAHASRDALTRPVPWRVIALLAAVLVLVAGAAVWRGRMASPEPSSVQPGNNGPHRLVVLPFENISGQSSDQWLAGAFADSLTLGLRDAKNLVLINRARVVELGDLGYWPPGKAWCIFFGQTPVSQPGKIMPASAVNVIGKVLGDATQFKTVMREREVIVEAH